MMQLAGSAYLAIWMFELAGSRRRPVAELQPTGELNNAWRGRTGGGWGGEGRVGERTGPLLLQHIYRAPSQGKSVKMNPWRPPVPPYISAGGGVERCTSRRIRSRRRCCSRPVPLGAQEVRDGRAMAWVLCECMCVCACMPCPWLLGYCRRTSSSSRVVALSRRRRA
jgi:hypothetical protein